MDIQDIVQNIPLFAQASPSTKSKLLSYGMCRSYPKDMYLFHAQEMSDYIMVVVSGLAVIERINRSSHRRTIFILKPGEIVNEVILEKNMTSVDCYALTDLQTVCFPRIRFLEIMESDFSFTQAVLRSMSVKIRRLYRQLGNTTKMSHLDRQIASRLYKLCRDFGIQREGFWELPFDLSITFLATMVGSNRETVSRIVKKMAQQNILSIYSGTCKIYDLDALVRYEKKNKPCSGSRKEIP